MTILKKIGKVLGNSICGCGAAVVLYLIIVGIYSTIAPNEMSRLLNAATDDYERYRR